MSTPPKPEDGLFIGSPDSLIDTHCHIDFAAFDADREQVIADAEKLGVQHIIVPGVAQAGWQKTINTCAHYPQLQLALGLHPVYTEQHQPHHLVELDTLISANQPIAVGEIGLDYYLRNLDREKQAIYFTKQLIIARQHQLPVIIHNRKAHDDCLNILREVGAVGGIIHAFNGSIQQAQKYVELGFALGFGGMLTHPQSNKLRNLVEALPLETIVLETDAPDMTVWQHRGSRNSPEYLPYVQTAVAALKGISAADVATATSRNVRRVFAW